MAGRLALFAAASDAADKGKGWHCCPGSLQVILGAFQSSHTKADVTSRRARSRYLHVPGLLCAMHRQLVLQAGNADDLHQSWRRRHQLQRGPGLPGVPAHPHQRSQATGVAEAQAGQSSRICPPWASIAPRTYSQA